MEQHFTEFPEKTTVFRNISRFFWKFLPRTSFPFDIQAEFLFRNFQSDGLSCRRFNSFRILFKLSLFLPFGISLVEWKAPLIRCSSKDTRKVVMLKLTVDAVGHFRIHGSG